MVDTLPIEFKPACPFGRNMIKAKPYSSKGHELLFLLPPSPGFSDLPTALVLVDKV